MNRDRTLLITVAVLLTLYVGSYLALSRMGIQQAAVYDSEVYYFVEPTSDGRVNSHLTCCLIYQPLIYLERLLGSPYCPGSGCQLTLS